MTNEELEKLANLIADKVIYKIEEKQKEWDDQFVADMTASGISAIAYNYIDEEEALKKELEECAKKWEESLNAENYIGAKKFFDRATEIKNKLNNLNKK